MPTFAVGDELFWGYDALPFLAEYLAEPARVRAEVLAPADAMREGRGRPGAAR